MSFAKPAFITLSLTEQDTLNVKFLNTDLFVDKIDYEKLASGTQLSVNLPSQMSMAELAELVKLEKQVSGPMTIFSTI